MSIESDLKVIGPNDKLILVTKKFAENDIILLCSQVESLLKSKEYRVLLMNNFDAYVIKKGANIQIRDQFGQMSKELKLAMFGDVGFDS